ncbi:hypothetical protein QBC43DRAFT_326196 [Cladorrhinum sp. PSN259]|nr:hypothetical protein QBC43DRAFT_326196 [Cladorrhinum sp. PSN259]
MDRLAADSGPRDSGSGPGPAGWRESAQLNNGHQRNSASGSSATAAASAGSQSNNNNGYHDGLIPNDQIRHSTTYPEVVPSEFAAAANIALPQSGRNSPAIIGSQEKTYPEVNTTPSIHLEKNYPEVADSTHSRHSSHHPHRHSNLSHPGLGRPTPSPAPTTALSTVHSMHGHAGAATRTSLAAWSEAGEDIYQEPIPTDGKPFKQKVKRLYKQPIVWVVVGAVIIIAVLAGILGAIATGKIKTAATKSSTSEPKTSSSSATSGSNVVLQISTGAGGQVIKLSCPTSQNVNYTATATPGGKTFRRQCGINFPEGDGVLGKVNGTEITTLTDCLEQCASKAECAGAVWSGKASGGPECWLKQFIGVGKATNEVGVEAGVLWQQ